jgi:hypothetical protein
VARKGFNSNNTPRTEKLADTRQMGGITRQFIDFSIDFFQLDKNQTISSSSRQNQLFGHSLKLNYSILLMSGSKEILRFDILLDTTR